MAVDEFPLVLLAAVEISVVGRPSIAAFPYSPATAATKAAAKRLGWAGLGSGTRRYQPGDLRRLGVHDSDDVGSQPGTVQVTPETRAAPATVSS